MPLACAAGVPALLPVLLAQPRVQQAQEVGKALPTTTLHAAAFGAMEYPGELRAVPEQCPLALLPIALCAPQWSAKGAGKNPFGVPTCRDFLNSIL